MSKGFSLLEVLISFGIVLTALLLIVGSFIQLFAWGSKTTDLAAGALVAEQISAQTLYGALQNDVARRNLFDAIAAGSYAPPGVMAAGTVSNPGGMQFGYAIYAAEVPGVGSTPDNRTAKVDTVVTWWSGGHQGAGELKVELTRLVNENSRY